jgi:hypothetical protein
MRNYREPTAKNLLREPLVLGVPLPALLGLSLLTLGSVALFGDSRGGGVTITIIAGTLYLGLRITCLFAKTGWLESGLFVFERKGLRRQLKDSDVSATINAETLAVHAPETMEVDDLTLIKGELLDVLSKLSERERLIVVTRGGSDGVWSESSSIDPEEGLTAGSVLLYNELSKYQFLYSLHSLPAQTTPLWLPECLRKAQGKFTVVSSFRGLSAHRVKGQIETARRRNARIGTLSNVDADVAFKEATDVLEGLSRGDDAVVEGSVLVGSHEPIDLDSRYFMLESKPELSMFSVTGLRHRFHRAHTVRAVTASDLILNIGDPFEAGSLAILRTLSGHPLYFNPLDSRLEALHWLVAAASGSGKSFFVGLVLLRLIRSGSPISILFVDHNRSFRRVTQNAGLGEYLEARSFDDLAGSLPGIVSSLGKVGTIAGIELSDLAAEEKRAAVRILLSEVERWLRSRDTIHPVYLVLDECWNFMRDEPLLVQRAFREFRKLNGAAIAITQSLSDFLMDESGRAIFQNAPIRILLRQAEDLEPYRGVLGLNDVELRRLRSLRQKKGEFSECLIKTPYLSRLGRLYPTSKEHELLRTDNIREELVGNHKKGLIHTNALISSRDVQC